jgi:hypothetical protein
VRKLGIVLLVLAVLAAGAFAWIKFSPRHAPAGQPALFTLSGSTLQHLRDDFNGAAGKVRVLALLSPT